jgi:hypothetical protein
MKKALSIGVVYILIFSSLMVIRDNVSADKNEQFHPLNETLNPIWNNTWGDSIMNDEATSIAVDTFNIYVVGTSYHAPMCYSFILKYQLDGNLLWTKKWGEDSCDHFVSIAVDGSNLYIVGHTVDPDIKKDGVLLLKFDLNGNLLWSRTWGGDSYDYGSSIAIKGSNIYVVGYTDRSNLNDYDAFVLKYNSDGKLLWEQTWGGNLRDCANAISMDDSDIYIVGQTKNFNGSFTGAFILKYDLSGNLLWNKTWGDSIEGDKLSIASSESYVYITGSVESSSSKDYDIFLLQYDSNGNRIWNTTWGGNNTEESTSIAINDSSIYIAGGTGSYGAGSNDAFILKYDRNGKLLWNKTWGTNEPEWITAIALDISNIYAVGIEVNYMPMDFNTFILKCDLNGSSFSYPFVLYTIPANSAINIELTTKIIIVFSEAMNQTAAENAISSNPNIKGKFMWDNSSKNLTIEPDIDLQVDTKYVITIDITAKNMNGVRMVSQCIFFFSTKSTATQNGNPILLLMTIVGLIILFSILVIILFKRRKDKSNDKKVNDAIIIR